MDIVIVRENEEDLYAGIEHQQTDEVAMSKINKQTRLRENCSLCF
jgi:isocitrate/isopropylmalate dehydrogenase